nr:MAG TPA: hypothetical protein [Caudoviricetes sp.]
MNLLQIALHIVYHCLFSFISHFLDEWWKKWWKKSPYNFYRFHRLKNIFGGKIDRLLIQINTYR